MVTQEHLNSYYRYTPDVKKRTQKCMSMLRKDMDDIKDQNETSKD